MPTAVHRSGGNVFRDLGFPAGEATTLKVRSDLMIRLTRVIEDRHLTRPQAARLFAAGLAEVDDLTGGKIDRFDVDTLVAMLGRAGLPVQLVVGPSRTDG